MTDLDRSGFPEFDRVLELVRRTREILDALAGDRPLPADATDFLAAATLPYLEGVQAGFVGWLRSDAADPAELRWLLGRAAQLRVGPPHDAAERVAADAELEAERLAAARTGRAMPRLRGAEPWDLIRLAHARVVLGWIPRIPESAVRYPTGRRTYADIPRPRTPAELVIRIDELERLLWQVAIGRPTARAGPAFRRTYGFFDTADRLGLGAFREAA